MMTYRAPELTLVDLATNLVQGNGMTDRVDHDLQGNEIPGKTESPEE